MKRILPLILALVAGMAQADSNSDYRAGSDFARQIQGQGTGSIQGFKPQESIPSYNANPDETKYYGGVTAGGDGGLKNDGTTEWATGETGKTITESFMNKPKDILSPFPCGRQLPLAVQPLPVRTCPCVTCKPVAPDRG